MSNLKLWLGICMVLFVFLTIGNAQSKVIYVPDEYNKVQQAVDAAFEGDTIIVRDGIYSENINVHERLTIRSEKGPESCIIKSASSNDNVFDIVGDHVNISGFTVRGATVLYAGIHLYGDCCYISNNICSDNYYGIYLTTLSNNNSITGNNCCSNKNNGIFLLSSNSNSITNNNCCSNKGCGISLALSNDNRITKNHCSNNYFGIYLVYSNDNVIYLNNFIDNKLRGCTYNVYSSDSNNIWNSTEKTTFTYKGKTFTNYLGNYWGDYRGRDVNRDGIRDASYIRRIFGHPLSYYLVEPSEIAEIEPSCIIRDDYPLMESFENYKIGLVTTPSPGFEFLFAIAGLLAVAYLVGRKK